MSLINYKEMDEIRLIARIIYGALSALTLIVWLLSKEEEDKDNAWLIASCGWFMASLLV